MSLQVAEQWRDRLIVEEAALSIWLEHFPGTDVQQLRSLIRQSRKDIEKEEQAAAAAAAAGPDAEPGSEQGPRLPRPVPAGARATGEHR